MGVAETVESGERYEEAGSRGLKEELGISVLRMDLIHSFQFRLNYRSPNHNVNYKVYKVFFNKVLDNQRLVLQEDEIDSAEFIGKEDIKKLITSGDFHPGSSMIFEKYIKMKELE